MSVYPDVLQNLIDGLNALPGIGKRSAERIALYLLDAKPAVTKHLGSLISDIQEKITSCPVCNNFSETEECKVCSDSRRDKSTVCIVEYPKDVIALEKTGAYKGVYFVLLGSISPIDGRGPADIDLGKLIRRIQNQEVKEIIIATDADSEGEATALYLKNILVNYDVAVSRIGIGVPLGSQIEFADAATLAKSLSERRSV